MDRVFLDGQGISGWNMPGCKDQIRSGGIK